MFKLTYPEKRPFIRIGGGREQIFCAVRKKWMVLTPEEWVRQHVLIWLLQERGCPPALTAVEKQISIGEMKMRFDIVVYDRNGAPFLMIECKQMEIELDETILQQVLRYNIGLRSSFLAITNGRHLAVFGDREGLFTELDELPEYPA